MTTRLSDLDVTPGELTQLVSETDAWVADNVNGAAAWLDGETDTVIIHESTPEGVPEDYEYVAPDEEPPEGHDVTESPQGAMYISPEPTGDGPDGGADDTMDVEAAKDEIFYQSPPAEGAAYESEEDAAVGLVESGKTDVSTAAQALIELEGDIDADGYGLSGQNLAQDIGNAVTGQTKYGENVDASYVTHGYSYATTRAREEYEEEYPDVFTDIVDEGVGGWVGAMFTEDAAPLWQVAASETGNDTLPEGGRFGDDRHIPSVLEMTTGPTERDAVRAKMEQSQEFLRDAFGDTVTIFRGLSEATGNPTATDPSEAPATLKSAAEDGENVEHEHRPAESWTTDAGYASYYAKRSDRRDQPDSDGVLIRKEVPVENVLMASHATRKLPANESEIIVMHDEEEEYAPDQIIPADELDNQTLAEQQLMAVTDDESPVAQEASEAAYSVDAASIDPQWLHTDPPGDIAETDTEAAHLSDLDVTWAEMHVLSAKAGEWVPYEGPDGGEGWQNRESGEVVYDDDPPGETADTAESRARELTTQVSDILGDDPGREDFALAEETVENATGVDNVDYSSFDRQQAETVSAELARMDARDDLDGLEEVSSTVPPTAESEYGELPMHYDRDGKGVSIDPAALGEDMTATLNEEGITATDDAEHLMRHAAALHKYAEELEAADQAPDGNPDESADQQLDEDDDADVDTDALAAEMGQLALATGATLVAETYTMVRAGRPTNDQIARAYQYFGGPTLEDL